MGVISRHWAKLSIAQRRADPKTYAARTYFSGGHNSKQNRPVPACHTRCRISAQIAGLGSFKDPIIFRDAQMGSWGEMLRWGAGETCSPAPPQYSIPRWITVSHNRYLERQTCKTVEKNAHVKRHLRNEILNKISSDPKLLCKSRDMAIAVDERVRDGTDNREGLAFNPRHHRDQSHLLGARVCGTFAVQFMGSAICRPAARAPASSDTAGHGGNERGGSQMGPARRTLFHSGAAALNLSCTVIRHLLPPLSGSNK